MEFQLEVINIEKILVNTKEKFEQFLIEINKKGFAFDTETTGLNIQTLKICGMSFCDGKKSWYLPFGHITSESQLNIESYCEGLKTLFYNAQILVGHNLVYDMQVLRKYNIYPEKVRWFDTIIAQHLINENESKGLKHLAKKYFNYSMETFDEVTNKTKTIENVNPSRAYSYACDDAIMTLKLFVKFKEILKQKDLENLFHNIEMPFLRCIVDMEWNGVEIDKQHLNNLKSQMVDELLKSNNKLISLLPNKYKQQGLFGGYASSFDFNSSKELGKLLYGELGLEKLSLSEKTGEASTGLPVLERLKKQHPIIPVLIEYKKLQKLNTAFLNSLPNHIQQDGRVHCKFNNTGTVTGRLSSSNPNLQQLPKNEEFNFRKCFKATKGYKFLTLDYSQEELRFAAFLSKDRELLESYEKGLDLHLATANKAFHLGLNEKQLTDNTPEFKEAKNKFNKERNNAKALNFGILYGRGPHSLKDVLGITLQEAEKMVKDYFKAYPQLKQAIDKTHQEIRDGGFVRNYFGRYRHFYKDEEGKYPGNCFRQSFNFKIQGACSDLLRIAMVQIRDFLKQNNNEARLIFTVHDEMTLEVPENKAQWYYEEIKKIMENCFEMVPKLVATGEIGDNYGETK